MSLIGNYNPFTPQILGQEFVPVRDEDLVFSPSVNSLEKGTSFGLAAATTVRDARYYVHELPPTMSAYQTTLVNIYPAGKEALSGPIYETIIPVSSGGITGADISLSGASSVQSALYTSAGAGGSIAVNLTTATSGGQRLRMQFDTAPYIQLAGKRILNVSLIYAGSVYSLRTSPTLAFPYVNPDPTLPLTVVRMVNGPSNMGDLQNQGFISNTGALILNTNVSTAFNSVSPLDYQVLNLGDIFNWWDPARPFPLSSSVGTNDVVPWRYQDLLRFDESTAAGSTLGTMMLINVLFQASIPADAASVQVRLDYAALRVQYCEETRVAYGGYRGLWKNGVNIATIRDSSNAADPILPAGNYTVTVSMVNPGDIDFTSTLGPDTPKLNALRELYQIPPHPGWDINIPFPVTDRLGDTFTKESTHVLPQLTLHGTTGAPLTEPHVYGRQIAAQIYGVNTATQEIIQSPPTTGSASYPWVRYIARRFGDTTVPLRLENTPPTGGTGAFSVQIMPADFDALDEILDGWKEVTLEFTTPPTMNAVTARWKWSALGEVPGNRWEVLGASAPGVSGIPGNLLNLVPTTQRLNTATYFAPGGDVQELNWMPQGVGSPWVTGATDDDSSDAFIIFAQDMPTVTGFSISTQTQAVTGIGQQCSVDPCCIPTDILYNRITWGLPVNTGVASDSFTRTVAAGSWGDADVGGTYTLSGTAADFSVNGTQGVITSSSTAADRYAVLPAGVDFDITVDVAVVTVPGGTARAGATGRYTDASNNYVGRYEVDSAGAVTISIVKRVASVLSTIVTVGSLTLAGGSGAFLTIRFMGQGTLLKLKVWQTGEPEPAMWDLEATDSSLTTGSLAGAYIRDATTTNTYLFDNLSIGPPAYWFGNYELQRSDTVETDWLTIMAATDPGTTTFNDYEARIGIATSYRIRGVNVYDFYGPWTTGGSITIPAPGVSGGCLEGGHLLVFTSNEHQDGSINLAYSSAWMDERVEEDFTFPESEFVQLQLMYDRDYVTAFRPLERGGERFSRTLLVQAAAIAPETLGDFKSLRDMAWDSVNYICVRDEDGNRWFATVIVPSGRVLRDRRLYLAPVEIIETNDVPTPVNP